MIIILQRNTYYNIYLSFTNRKIMTIVNTCSFQSVSMSMLRDYTKYNTESS
ncbi:unnamed protein product [Schistosoma mattheei]|uniref:Uncharacterized protein n=1 Tax=Schistosoma mattheei TaxID=31246 RepID=A0A183PX01_9TREM|nr:unnamed protein product [Schistosoma mattheei]